MGRFLVRVFALVAVMSGIAALAIEPCQLEKPIPFRGNLLEQDLTLNDVIVDGEVQFIHPDKYDPKKDSLILDLFNIVWNDKQTGFLGASLRVGKTLESVVSPNFLILSILIVKQLKKLESLHLAIKSCPSKCLSPYIEYGKPKKMPSILLSPASINNFA